MSEYIKLKNLSRLSTFAGVRYPMPENYHKWSKYRRYIWILYADLVQITFAIEMCSMVIRISISPDDLGVFCACVVAIGYVTNHTLKMVIFTKQRKLFLKLFCEMCNISEELSSNPIDDGYIQFYDTSYGKIFSVALVKGGIEVTAVVLLILIFVARSYAVGIPEDFMTPALTWTPYNNSYNPVYSLTCFFEMIVFGGITLRNAALDLLFWSMLMVPNIQLRYLRILLNNIMEERQNPKNDLKTEFIWWIKYHQRVLGMIQEFRTISSPYLGMNYLTTLLNLILAGLVAISTTSWNIFQQAVINGIVISNTIQLYFMSLTGDWLSESSENAAEGGFSITLLSSGKSLMRDYLFVCARSKRSLQIRFGGINRLCSENFEQLIRMTITYLVTMVQLRNEDKDKSET